MAHSSFVGRTHPPRKVTLYESRREREFYRYYEPIRALTGSGPQLCDLHDEAAFKAHKPYSSPDPALTAFCQLGALRLGARRAMLFFFDSSYAYVLAEATRTLSLQDDSVHEIEDNLWLGHSIIPRGYTICEETVCRLPEEDAEDFDPDRSLIHVINDLDQDSQFCGRPYVKDGPKAKFYAGVPITSPRGINIGAYCLLDDRTRDGLDEKGIAFMHDMAKTVMTHLEMVRAKSEHERGTTMVSGLGAFIEGASSLKLWERDTGRRDYRRVGGAEDTPERKASPDAAQSEAEAPDVKSSHLKSGMKFNASKIKPQSGFTANKASGVPEALAPPRAGPHSAPKVSKNSRTATEDFRDQDVATNIRTTFQRAADLIRQSVDVDGAVFLDASMSTYCGLIDTESGSEQSSEAMCSATDATLSEVENRKRSDSRGLDKPCRVMASSHTVNDNFNNDGELHLDIQAANVTERFLRSLLRRNPRGKIWNFNETGDASSDDSSSEGGTPSSETAPPIPTALDDDPSEQSSTNRRGQKRRNRIDDGREIQRLFPGVRSVALVGMWDGNRGRWFSACAIWTYSPLRLFSRESEVNYMAAFCDIVMADAHRLEAQNSNTAKSDFISSISHELRSPLHGILGSVECLQDQPSADSFSTELVSQIEICGRTLLDIVNHLLDFSKINHHVKGSKALEDQRQGMPSRPPRMPMGDTKRAQLGNMMNMEADCSLDDVTEEVVETAVYSYACSREKRFILDRKVTVALDIERSPHINWRCKVALGGWKRVCINLVSNSLKYTSEGFVSISLKTEPVPGRKKKFNAVFQVTDSGRGMTRDFLENHLFNPFSQEDSLVEGTGLGLSLVAKIVKAMDGTVEVQSEKEKGSTITVTVPIDSYKVSREEKAAQSHLTKSSYAGKSATILNFGGLPSGTSGGKLVVGKGMLRKSIESHCRHLDLEVSADDHEVTTQADIAFIAEEDLARFAHEMQLVAGKSLLDKPLVVVCTSAVSLRQLRVTHAANGFITKQVKYVAQPCGTEQLRKVVESCLSGPQTSSETSSTEEDRQSTGSSSDSSSRTDLSEESGLASGHPLALLQRTQIPLHLNGAEIDSILYSPPPTYSPKALEEQQKRSPLPTPGGQNLAPAEDYLSSRSRSAGNAVASPPATSPKQPAVRNEAPSERPTGMSLLLVDDNPINLQLLVNYARKQGHRKQIATDGMQAVERYKATCLGTESIAVADNVSIKHGDVNSASPLDKPQVILMDINMPKMNGFEATREIRAFEQQHDLQPAHIIALTGLGSASAQHEAFSSGVDLFLTKPVRLKELTKVLSEIRSSQDDTGSSES
ncbi:hypothetical protein LTR78_003591 [Recurvomyces mirabilis]|uniref:histidine kinase n=1 Tax=Recurvomyces mirabilis TaxID=574656 RepID=A0AAE1C338_9PEZI|nr:hypothetical protein LTR78_003591 [Recurvomyces mirabilis]KAK5154706.1 hypothetical protein LTS14_006285 [Recurvomyces mirabilis]